MEHCEACGRLKWGAETESAHYTSEGVVRYRRCACGRRWVEVTALTPAGTRPR